MAVQKGYGILLERPLFPSLDRATNNVVLKETLIKSEFPATQGCVAPDLNNLAVTSVTDFEAS